MTVLDFIKESPFTILIIGIGIFELVQLVFKKREPTKLNIILYSLLVVSVLVLALAVFIAYQTEMRILTDKASFSIIANSLTTFIFFSAFLAFECVFYKRAKANKIVEENSKE